MLYDGVGCGGAIVSNGSNYLGPHVLTLNHCTHLDPDHPITVFVVQLYNELGKKFSQIVK